MKSNAATRSAPTKPVKLQMNNSGAWKDIVRFDAVEDERADAIMNAAAQLSDAACEGQLKPPFTLRIVTETADCIVLMQYKGLEGGWRDARTGEPA